MPEDAKTTAPTPEEPRGLGEHTRGLTAEYAHEQGWGLAEEQRTRLPDDPGDTSCCADFEYGAQDFGDQPIAPGRVRQPPSDDE